MRPPGGPEGKARRTQDGHRASGRARVLGGLLVLLLAFCAGAAALLGRELQAPAITDAPPAPADAALRERGAYLARIGNCAVCHTAPGGAAFAGGRGIATPFGTVYASNLTPDPTTGIGQWSTEAFWRAMHEGRSRDGHLLYPAFPYTNTTHVSRADSDAILAWLRSLPPVAQPNRAHTLRFPYNTQAALAVWRLLYFRAGEPGPVEGYGSAPAPSLAWQRGSYLVRGLGHCSACHGPRDALGGTGDALALDGGLMQGAGWYAPSLSSNAEAGVGDWAVKDIVALLTTGLSPRGSVQGPMAEVVHGSSQYLSADDAAAVAEFLKSLAPPTAPAVARGEPAPVPGEVLALRDGGAQLYREHCADCHGRSGEGVPGAYPALAGNRALLIDPAINLVQVIAHGGFAPVTAGNPRPYGMPPHGLVLDQRQIASLITYLRSAWGHQAAAVSALEVQRWREVSDGDR